MSYPEAHVDHWTVQHTAVSHAPETGHFDGSVLTLRLEDLRAFVDASRGIPGNVDAQICVIPTRLYVDWQLSDRPDTSDGAR